VAFVIVTHIEPLYLRLQQIEYDRTPADHVALAYHYDGHLLARGTIAADALPALESLLENPVMLSLAARDDVDGNIDARICLVLPIAGESEGEAEDGEAEPWKASVPSPAWESEKESPTGSDQDLALLPIGNVVRSAANRNHEDLAADAREMLANLLSGNARDAVDKAIDDLLGSL
jgi:hypothetical protein